MTISTIKDGRRARVAVLITFAALLLAAPARADGEFAITAFGGSVTDAQGMRETRAAAHPDLKMTFELSSRVDANGNIFGIENMKDVTVELPKGVVGDPSAATQCRGEELTAPGTWRGNCPVDAQVGTVVVPATFGLPFTIDDQEPVFNIIPPPGVTARFGFVVLGNVVYLDASVTASGGYRIVVNSSSTSQGIAALAVRTTFWGVPSDPSHDLDRMPCLANDANVPNTTTRCAATSPRRPFITAPTTCSGGPLTTTLRLNTWQNPGRVLTRSFDHDFNGEPLTVEACDDVPFAPTLALRSDTHAPDSPTGMGVDLAIPQSDDPDGLASAHLKDVAVSLPDGLTINPASAAGLTACSDAQLGLGNDAPARCLESSKVATATATTPLLSETLTGSVYVLSQASDDPESGQMFRVGLVVASEERGVLVKLGGNLVVNKDTGRITATFKDNPQMPVSDIKLSFKGGPRAPLATPASCGEKAASAELAAWSGRTVALQPTIPVDCAAGLGGFAPTLRAGVVAATGGASSPFTLSIGKPDGDAALTGLSMVFPTGLLARLKGNLGTQVGSVRAFAGPGANPYMLPGRVYLEGPYADAPFSLRVVVPAKAGPFDLGEVVVRQKIYVDPIDAHVTVVSDPLPTIVKGVPVRLQRLEVEVDKPGFMVNPTSCAAKSIVGTLSAVDGQTAALTNRFQVSECSSLALQPKLALSLSGKGQTTDGKHPAVTAELTQPAGQANLKKVRVALPLSLALDPDNAASDGLCSFVEGSKPDPQCPASSVVGKATAVTPILDEPLSGPVYFVKNERKDPKSGRSIKTTPKLVIPLVGQNGVKLTLTGESTVVDDRLITTFNNIPDAPVSSFKLDIVGGKKGILVISGDKVDICKATQIADQQVDGQNNKAADADVSIQTPSCPLRVLSKTVGKSSVSVKVGGLGAGKVTVSGKGIKKTSKTISKSTVATIVAKRTKGTPGKVTVSFDPAGPAKARKATK